MSCDKFVGFKGRFYFGENRTWPKIFRSIFRPSELTLPQQFWSPYLASSTSASSLSSRSEERATSSTFPLTQRHWPQLHLALIDEEQWGMIERFGALAEDGPGCLGSACPKHQLRLRAEMSRVRR